MSPLIAMDKPPELIQRAQSASVSDQAQELLSEVIGDFDTTASKSRAPMRDKLEDVVANCGALGWDGYDARPVLAAAAEEARLFVSRLPNWVRSPYISATPSGGIAFEWRRDKRHVLLLTLQGKQRLSYAAILGGTTKVHGTEPFVVSLPDEIERILAGNFRSAA